MINSGAHLAGHVTVGSGGFVGIGASVVQRATMVDWTRIGAGSTVIGDLPSKVTASGTPARVARTGEEGWHVR